jgi:hypothetical protein
MGKNTVKINRNLKKFKKPFWAVFAVFLALELTQSILRGVSFPINFFLIVIGVFYVLVGLACIIFYYITGVKLTRTLKMDNVEVSRGRAKRLARVRVDKCHTFLQKDTLCQNPSSLLTLVLF